MEVADIKQEKVATSTEYLSTIKVFEATVSTELDQPISAGLESLIGSKIFLQQL